MSKILTSLVLYLFVIGLCYGQLSDPEKTTKATTTTTTSTTESTTESTTTPSTTTPTTTTTTTTTPKPTTTTATTTTTTTTTTTPEPPKTTTVKPKPGPEPEIGKWNTSCVMIQMAAQFNFTYDTKDNKTARGLYNVPKDAHVSDFTCENMTQQIVLEWGPKKAVHSLLIQFDTNSTANSTQFSVFTILAKIQLEDDFPNAKENQTVQLVHMGNTFTTPLKMSYHCTRKQVLNMTETIEQEVSNSTLALWDVQFEAFHTGNWTKFSVAKDCDASDTPDIVPIAVGCALAALILVVLISYLFARRRSTARGYMSF